MKASLPQRRSSFLIRKGQTLIPANEKLILDITPVDQVASVMLAVSAQACIEEPRLVFQVATGDSNPNNMERIIGLVGLDKRRHFQEKESGNTVLNRIAARMEPRPVTTDYYEKASVPMFNATARKASSLLEKVRPRWGGGRVGEVIDRVKSGVERVEELTRETTEAFDMFRPFTIENAYVFRSITFVPFLTTLARMNEHSLPGIRRHLTGTTTGSMSTCPV
jgi:hypothetical protein